MNILAFGEVLWDVYPDKKYIGGAPLNFSAHAVMQGNSAYILSGVGDDALGKETVEKVNELKVKSDFVTVNDIKTGSCQVTLDSNNIPSYDLLDNVAYDRINTDIVPDGFNIDCIYFGTLALRHGFNRDSLKKLLDRYKSCDRFVDLNIRPPYFSKEAIEFAIGNSTVLKISDEELPTVTKSLWNQEITDLNSAAEKISSTYGNVKIIIITLGSKGSFAYDCNTRKTYNCNATKVKTVSTVGAGDSFSASFMNMYAQNKSIEECLSFASKVSAFVVSVTDAIPVYDVKRFE